MTFFAPGSRAFTGLLAAIAAMLAFGMDIALPASPAIAADLGTTPALAQLQISFFMIGVAVSQLPVGALADRFGRKPVLLSGIAVFVVGGLGAAAAQDVVQLAGARMLQGFGAAAGWSLMRAIVRDRFEQQEAARQLGSVVSAVAIAPLVAPIIGGWLLTVTDWRGVFVVLSTCGFLLLLLAWRRLGESIRQTDPLALRPGRLIGNLRRFFAEPTCRTMTFLLAILFAGQFAYVANSPFLLIETFGVSPQAYGFCFAVPAVALALGARWGGRLARRLDARRIVRGALWGNLLAAATIPIGPALGLEGWAGVSGVLIPLAINSFAFAVANPNTVALAMQPLPHMAGVASAILGSVQMAAGAIGAFLVNAIYTGDAWALAICLMVSGAAGFALGRGRIRLSPS